MIRNPVRLRWQAWLVGIALLATAWSDLRGYEPITVMFVAGASFMVVLATWVLGEVSRRHLNRAMMNRWDLLVTLLLLVNIAAYRPGIRAVFWVTRISLDKAAAELENGVHRPVPFTLGAFTVRETTLVDDKYPALVLDPNPGGATSLVKCPTCPGNEWSSLRLSEDWVLFSED